MIIDNILLIWFLGGIFLAGLIIIYYTNVYKNLYKKETLLRERETNAHQQAQYIIEDAHKEAEKIISIATDKANTILSQTDTFKNDIEKQMQEIFVKTLATNIQIIKENSTDVRNQYLALFSNLQNQYLEEVKQITSTLEIEGKKGITDFQRSVNTEIGAFQKDIRSRLESEMAQADKEIQGYKEEQLKHIQEKLEKHINDLSVQLLGKVIPLEEQENLLVEALEKAKKEGLFG